MRDCQDKSEKRRQEGERGEARGVRGAHLNGRTNEGEASRRSGFVVNVVVSTYLCVDLRIEVETSMLSGMPECPWRSPQLAKFLIAGFLSNFKKIDGNREILETTTTILTRASCHRVDINS